MLADGGVIHGWRTPMLRDGELGLRVPVGVLHLDGLRVLVRL